ncbi:response regulator [Candidatus Methylomirabilis limnetica]|uniref:Response regulator n=1 Tax=Candidatus Methylomirabilis limnetica TaxID=2033718 RepID=A0A2T4TWS8_9BACT|nr:response regulator [Candidatus Methylomirabilis limnetica]PTL35571.1 response regulator [Candidatus Methylomirabilis limnetica]
MSAQRLNDARQKILVVDDDCTLRELLADYLERVGFEVRTAPDGRAGLDALDGCHFDLILTDYRMSAMTGIEMAAVIRRSDTVTPIILITGDFYELNAEIVAQAGITRMLPKPLKLNELLTCVQTAKST